MTLRILWLLLGLCQLQVVKGQTVPSSCLAHDSILAKYRNDAEHLALRDIFEDKSSYMDSFIIPVSRSSKILDALIAVYNAKSLAARDTVISMLNIHAFPYPTLNFLIVCADSNLAWMKMLHKNILPTGNTEVDKIINDFNFHLANYFKFTKGNHIAVLESGRNYNISAIAPLFEAIQGVQFAEPDGIFGDGYDIEDSVYTDHIELIFSWAWGDCPSGCMYRRYWKFKVYNDCSVDYSGSYGSLLYPKLNTVSETSGNQISVFPNPFKELIFIDHLESEYECTLCDVFGTVVCTCRTTESSFTLKNTLPKGVYFLKLKSNTAIKTFKLIKD